MPLSFDFATLTKKDLQSAGFGASCEVVRIANTDVVAKIPYISPYCGPELHKIEKQVYERLQDYPNILRYLGQSPLDHKLLKGALLFEYHPKGNLQECLNKSKTIPGRRHWPYQAVSAIAYIHARGIVHADLGVHNFLLHDDGRIMLCDFAGSSVDGRNSHVAHGTRYTDPRCKNSYPDEREDVFALGSVLYELDRGHLLFDDLDNGEIRERLNDRRFPDLEVIPMPLRGVIQKCWTEPGYKAADALAELESQSWITKDMLSQAVLGLALAAVAVCMWKSSPAAVFSRGLIYKA